MSTSLQTENQDARAVLRITMAIAVAFALTVAGPQAAAASDIVPPAVPEKLLPPAGDKPFLVGHAYGTQNYICLPSGKAGAAWTFFGPQATLFDDADQQVMTHFLSPNPVENETPRPTWQDSRDSSSIWAVPIANSSDPAFVAPGSIPWLLLQVVGKQYDPAVGDKLIPTTVIQRVNTLGGIAPATGCSKSADVGKKAMVPYAADYFFYKR
jgi:hypothetical protein